MRQGLSVKLLKNPIYEYILMIQRSTRTLFQTYGYLYISEWPCKFVGYPVSRIQKGWIFALELLRNGIHFSVI